MESKLIIVQDKVKICNKALWKMYQRITLAFRDNISLIKFLVLRFLNSTHETIKLLYFFLLLFCFVNNCWGMRRGWKYQFVKYENYMWQPSNKFFSPQRSPAWEVNAKESERRFSPSLPPCRNDADRQNSSAIRRVPVSASIDEVSIKKTARNPPTRGQ